MDWLLNTFYYLVPFVVLLSVLVFVHELGHFLVARCCGVEVEEFSIGFGKEIWGFNDRYGTRWKVACIPLGGFVKMLGDGDASSTSEEEGAKELSAEDKKKSFIYQPPLKKIAIAIAGPGFNYLLAILIFFGVFYSMGKLVIPPVIGEVMSGGAAEKAGMLAQDRILKVNGHEIETFSDMQREVGMIVGTEVKLDVDRKGKVLNLTLHMTELEVKEADGKKVKKPMLGVKSVSVMELKKENLTIFGALSDAIEETWKLTALTLRGVGQMISGQRNADDVGGVIRIAEMTGDISKQHSVMQFLAFMALLSINLGLINLFPIPVLDGGQVLISAIEFVTRREMNERFKEYLFRIGVALILALLVFATWNDVVHLIRRFGE